MTTITKNGVCYALKDSPYRFTKMGITFCFSTAKNREKYIEQYSARISGVNNSLYRRFHFTIDATYIALIQLYLLIEHRGFVVYIEDKLIDNVDHLEVLCAISGLSVENA